MASSTNTRVEFGSSQAKEVSNKLGFGSLAESVRTLLEYGSPDIKVVAIPVAISRMGSAGSVTKTGTGKATSTTSGASYDAYEVIIEIIKGGDKDHASYKLSLDGGRSWNPEKKFAGDLHINIEDHDSADSNADLKITFTESSTASESFVKGDRYQFQTTAATATDINIRRSIENLSATYPDGNYLVAQGIATGEWVAYQTLLQQLLSKQNLVRMTLSAPYKTSSQTLTQWIDGLKTKAKELNETRLSIVAAYAPIPHTTGLQLKPLVSGAALLEAQVSKATSASIDCLGGRLSTAREPNLSHH